MFPNYLFCIGVEAKTSETDIYITATWQIKLKLSAREANTRGTSDRNETDNLERKYKFIVWVIFSSKYDKYSLFSDFLNCEYWLLFFLMLSKLNMFEFKNVQNKQFKDINLSFGKLWRSFNAIL